MALNAVTPEDKARIKHLLSDGIRVLQEVDDLKGGLRDTVKAVAQELDIQPKILNKALRAAYKSSIESDKELLDSVEQILDIASSSSSTRVSS